MVCLDILMLIVLWHWIINSSYAHQYLLRANCLPFLCSMAAANVARINHAEPGPIDTSLLTQQPNHRSEAIWNGQVKCNTKSLCIMYMHLIHTMYTLHLSNINPWFCFVQDPGTLTCRSRSSEFSNREPMVDD